MSRYVQFEEEGPQVLIASNQGWSDFGNWVDDLDLNSCPELVSFWEHGQSNDPKKLLEELKKLTPPTEVAEVVQELTKALQANPFEPVSYITQ